MKWHEARRTWNIYIIYKNRPDITPKRPKKLLLPSWCCVCVCIQRFSIAIKERVYAYINTRVDAQKQRTTSAIVIQCFSNWNSISWKLSKDNAGGGGFNRVSLCNRKKSNPLKTVLNAAKKKWRRKRNESHAHAEEEKEKKHSIFFRSQKMNSRAQLKLKTERTQEKAYQQKLCVVYLHYFASVKSCCWCYSPSCNSDIRVLFLSKTKPRKKNTNMLREREREPGIQNSIHLNR